VKKEIKFTNIKNFGYTIVKTLSIPDGVEFIRALPQKHSSKKGFSRKHAIAELAAINPACVCCGLVGSKLCLGKDGAGGVHWDLYTDDDIALSVDHIVPKALGGKNHMENFQIMCSQCNTLKQHFPKRTDGYKKLLDLLKGEFEVQIKMGKTPFLRIGYWKQLDGAIFSQIEDYFHEVSLFDEDCGWLYSYYFKDK